MVHRAALILAVCFLSAIVTPIRGAVVTNAVSRFPVVLDGQFSDGFPFPAPNGRPVGEWSDVAPLAFIAPPDDEGTLFQTNLGDPRANSLLYAAIALGVSGEVPEEGLELYLMYAYRDRTNAFFSPGEFIARVVFPVTVDGVEQVLTVLFQGKENGAVGLAAVTPDSFFDVFFQLDGGELFQGGLDSDGAIGFGPSPLSPTDHMLIELEVSLRIPPEFGTPGGPFPGNGINPATGLYDPDPAFWGAFAANDAIDPPISAAIFTINRDGSTTANSNFLPTPNQTGPVPEPGTLSMFWIGGAALLGIMRVLRKQRERRTFPSELKQV